MKRLLSFTLVAIALSFTACQEESTLISPQNEEATFTTQAEPNWISLPAPDGDRVQKKFMAFKWITKKHGGKIEFREKYKPRGGKRGDEVKITSSLEFDKNAVEEDHLMFMLIDDRTGTSKMLPHQEFNSPGILNQKFENIDLSFIEDEKNVKYYYLSADGTYEEMECDEIKVDIKKGKIEIINGRIPHFSRYGFAN